MHKILVIEDDYSVRDNLLHLLETEEFEALGASNGKIGVELAFQHRPDLIICDVLMPGLDGFGVLTALRSSPDTKTIPFIFLTARTEPSDWREGMSLGADDYLTKPFTREELLTAISTRLEKQAAIKQQQAQKLDQLRTSINLSLPIELRSPLHTILGFSQYLTDSADTLEPSEIREISQTIHKSGERLYRLVQNFLLYAELELIATSPQRIEALRSSRTSSVVSLIEHTSRLMSQRVHREADLQLQLIDSSVQINKSRLEKIVEELLDNSFKFSDCGTPVRVVATPNAEMFTLSVTNYGRGMSAAQIAQVGAYQQFERKFYEQQGSGLGLSIIKHLAQLLGGELSIDSTPGKHTTVTVVLPI